MNRLEKTVGALATAMVLLIMAGCGSKQEKPANSINGPALGTPEGNSATRTPSQPQLQSQPQHPRSDAPAVLHPKVVLDTTLGKITVELDAKNAKLTTKNFLDYADSGYYDQTLFHQVIKGYVILGGSYSENFTEKKPGGLPIRNEADNGLTNRRYTIAMARSSDVIDSATSQFFFNLRDNALLDHHDRTPQGYGYCVFGQVIAGQEVLDQIAQVEVRNTEKFDQVPVQPVLVRSVRRQR